MLLKFQYVYAEADFHNKILKEILHSSQFFLQLRCRDQHWNLYAQTTLSPTRIPIISITRLCVCVCVHINAKMCMCTCPCACHGGQVLGGFEVDNFNFHEEAPTQMETQRHKVEKIQDQLVISKQGKREFSEVSMDISNI